MNGPRGSLVIALLFFIGGQLAVIASALSGQRGSALGFLMLVFAAVAVIRVVVELFREGAGQRGAAEERELTRKQRRPRRKGAAQQQEGPRVTDPVTPTALRDPASRTSVSHLDPEKWRPGQD